MAEEFARYLEEYVYYEEPVEGKMPLLIMENISEKGPI